MWLVPAFSLVANAAARPYYRLTLAGERGPAGAVAVRGVAVSHATPPMIISAPSKLNRVFFFISDSVPSRERAHHCIFF